MSPAYKLISNPVTQAVMRSQLKHVLSELQTEAGLQVYIGGDAKAIIKRVGKLCIVANNSAVECGIAPDSPDVRILAGMASTLLDLSRPGEDIERHRGALRSGLAACQRVLSRAGVWRAGKALMLAESYINAPVQRNEVAA